MKRKTILLALSLVVATNTMAQVGEHRNELAVGPSAGYVLSNVGFSPNVPQSMLGGLTGGLTVRYTCEKYFKSICAIVGEVNYAQIGWKESILDLDDQPVINSVTGVAEKYSRKMTYVQVPVFARMGWGRERRGFQFFFQVGPQMGLYLNDKTEINFDLDTRNSQDRTNNIVAQDTMAVENKFDYGIAGGLGMEYSNPRLGHFLLEGRYYYGLGDIYGNSKRDYFGRSNFGNIYIKLTWLFDIVKSKHDFK